MGKKHASQYANFGWLLILPILFLYKQRYALSSNKQKKKNEKV